MGRVIVSDPRDEVTLLLTVIRWRWDMYIMCFSPHPFFFSILLDFLIIVDFVVLLSCRGDFFESFLRKQVSFLTEVVIYIHSFFLHTLFLLLILGCLRLRISRIISEVDRRGYTILENHHHHHQVSTNF